MTTARDKTLDSVLADLGDFGPYQVFVLTLVCIAVVIHSAAQVAFVFTAKDVEYRCAIPNCDTVNDTEYMPIWLDEAVPFHDDRPSKCHRFAPIQIGNDSECSYRFNQSQKERCDSFVFKNPERTILHDFGLFCEENVWKLTMVGTFNNLGQFIGLPITGILSDRYGRKLVLIMGLLLCGLSGLARSVTTTYSQFVILEALDEAFGAGAYSCGFILGAELVGPKKRVLSSLLVCCSFAIGEIFISFLAWMTQSWRLLLQVFYLTPFLLISYFWLIPESVRWLLAQNRCEEAASVLRKAAKLNGKTISEDTLSKLCIPQDGPEEKSAKSSLGSIIKSRILLLRFINSCFCWSTCAFLFYGFTLNSISLAGNGYMDFILTSLVEIPAYFVTYLVVDTMGRKMSLGGSFFISAISCFAFILTPTDMYWVRLVIYLSGKFGATAAFTIAYIICSEMFPTPVRHTLMGLCAMISRFGSMLSPQMPLLAQIWTPLPLIVFGTMAILAGVLTSFFPETLHIKLPDTIEEAENIGKDPEQLKINRKIAIQ